MQKMIFSKTSLGIHTVWFALWFLLGLDVNFLTLIVSLEAIYITLFIGLEQQDHVVRNAKQHRELKTLLKKGNK